MARPKLTDEGTGKPISIRLTDALMDQINSAAKKLDIPAREVMRLCMRIGVEHFKRIDYDTAKCIVESVESQKAKVITPSATGGAHPAFIKFQQADQSLVAEEHHKAEGHDGLH